MKALQTTATKGSNKTLKNLKEGIMKTKIMATCLVVALMFLVGGHALGHLPDLLGQSGRDNGSPFQWSVFSKIHGYQYECGH